MKLGLIGNGAIARVLTRHCEQSDRRFEITGALVLPEDGPSVGQHPTFTAFELLAATAPDLIIECAGQQAVVQYGHVVLQAGMDLMVISVGALADDRLRTDLEQSAVATGRKVIIPTGALAGLDALSAARVDGLDRVSLKTRKPPQSWTGAPGVAALDLTNIITATDIFTGSAREAALAFPKNANVAAAVALAGIGFDQTDVVLTADPTVKRNTHLLEAEGAFGQLRAEIQAKPSPDNPKTSHLAALSIIRQLNRLTDTLVI